MHTYTPSNSFHTTVQMPDDGDNGTASNQNVADEAALDNTNYLYNLLPIRRLIKHYMYPALPAWENNPPWPAMNITELGYQSGGGTDWSGGSPYVVVNPTANVFPCQIGDIIDVDGQFHSACTVGGSNDALTVEYAIYCCTTDSGGIAQYPTYVAYAIAPNNSLAYPIHLRGRYIAEVAGPLCVWIKCRFSVGGSGGRVSIMAPTQFLVQQFR